MSKEARQNGTGNRKASLGALLIVIPWSFVMWLGLHDWYNEIQLGKRAVSTSGVITKIEHENHQQYDYEYSVGGITYKGGEIIAGASLGVGQQVRVSYISDSPGTSTLTGFGAVGTRPVPLLLCTFIALYCYIRLRKFLKGPANPYDR
jgi:hypothetical protein